MQSAFKILQIQVLLNNQNSAYYWAFVSPIRQFVMIKCINIFRTSSGIFSVSHHMHPENLEVHHKFSLNEGWLSIIAWNLSLSNHYGHHAVIMKREQVIPWNMLIASLASRQNHSADNYSNSASEFSKVFFQILKIWYSVNSGVRASLTDMCTVVTKSFGGSASHVLQQIIILQQGYFSTSKGKMMHPEQQPDHVIHVPIDLHEMHNAGMHCDLICKD